MNHEHSNLLNMKEQEILEKAVRQFGILTGAAMQVTEKHIIKDKKQEVDVVIELRNGKEKLRFWTEVKNEIREIQIPQLLGQITTPKDEWLLICQYIPKPVKAELKRQAINYLEAAGNCFIKRQGIFFYINDQAVTDHRQPKEGKLWNQAGLKFLFAVLLQPDLLNAPYRKLAQAANVALGNIGPFVEELKEEGFIKEGKKNKEKILFIENKEQLQQKWVELFYAILRPKLKRGKFRFLDNVGWTKYKGLLLKDIYWGAEPAGGLLTGFLTPEVFTLYTGLPTTDVMKQLKLVPDEQGNVELLDIFWNTAFFDNDNTHTVPPLLAYAELITSLDSRNRETAERIKTKYLG